jgi:hypothetical protein
MFPSVPGFDKTNSTYLNEINETMRSDTKPWRDSFPPRLRERKGACAIPAEQSQFSPTGLKAAQGVAILTAMPCRVGGTKPARRPARGFDKTNSLGFPK